MPRVNWKARYLELKERNWALKKLLLEVATSFDDQADLRKQVDKLVDEEERETWEKDKR